MKKISIVAILLCNISMHATVLVPGDAAAPFSFSVPISTKVFDRATGTFFVGLSTPPTNAVPFTISKALRRQANAPSKFVGIFPTTAPAAGVEFLALSTCESALTCLTCPQLCLNPPSPCSIPCNNVPQVPTPCAERTNLDANLILVPVNANGPFTSIVINAMNQTGTIFTSLALIPPSTAPGLLDASGALNQNGTITTGIVGLAANKDFAFAVVRPAGTGNNFGEPNGGVASVSIQFPTLALMQVPAVPGDTGIKAAPLNQTSPAVIINNPTTMVINTVDIIWDDPLQLLYLGIQLQTANQPASGGRSVVIGRVGPCGTITFTPIAPDGAFALGNTAQIVGVVDDTPRDLAAIKIRIMHTSPGPSYLIVNGGNGTATETNNLVFALPLVDQPFINNNPNPAHGTIADKNSPLVKCKFVTPAETPAQMPLDTEPAVMVGAGPLPILPTTPIADMVVEGDTVYVSINANPNEVNDAGIFYSQALFDQNGKILRWTPWTKRAFPVTAFNNTTSQCHRTSFFAVDLVNDVVWAVDGETKRIVEQTAWKAQINDCSLVGRLNAALCCGGATSVLDLDQATRGFTGEDTTFYRYAAFGGNGVVAFAVISKSLGESIVPPENIIEDPQLVTTNFLAPGYFLVTDLPKDACAVNTLEYARQLPGTNTNYFFAGTNTGLYVLSDSFGVGLDVANFGLLNQAPFLDPVAFDNRIAWHKAPTISGNVIRVRTTGNTLYVLTYTTTKTVPLANTLYRIDFKSTIQDMFAFNNVKIIAQSNTGSLLGVKLINDFQIISTQPDGSTEQLVLATNRGLYKSSRPGGVQAAANQADANWQNVDPAFVNFYNGIGAPDTNIPVDPPSTLWPFGLVQSVGPCAPGGNRGTLEQLAGTSDSGPFNRVPPFFISIECRNPDFNTIPAINYFWSDGARRIGITAGCPAELLSFPYNTLLWNIESPDQAILQDHVLESFSTFYWIKQIGVTGMLLVGTETGVVGLQ